MALSAPKASRLPKMLLAPIHTLCCPCSTPFAHSDAADNESISAYKSNSCKDETNHIKIKFMYKKQKLKDILPEQGDRRSVL